MLRSNPASCKKVMTEDRVVSFLQCGPVGKSLVLNFVMGRQDQSFFELLRSVTKTFVGTAQTFCVSFYTFSSALLGSG